MRSDVTDTERTLPRRDLGQDSRCINPWCLSTVRVRGEHCRTCHKAAMQKFREQRQAS